MHLLLFVERKIEELARDALDLLDQSRIDAMPDNDIETDLTAGAVELRGDPAFAFRRACKVRGNVDHRNKARRLAGHCVTLSQ